VFPSVVQKSVPKVKEAPVLVTVTGIFLEVLANTGAITVSIVNNVNAEIRTSTTAILNDSLISFHLLSPFDLCVSELSKNS
jgi:hypothetical protein